MRKVHAPRTVPCLERPREYPKMALSFTKMQALGNDFLLTHDAPPGWPDAATVRRLADRRTGVGFDQLLLVRLPGDDGAQAAYRIFNADGSEVEQCGNGARCIARWVAERLGLGKELVLQSPGGPLCATLLDDGGVRLEMGVPGLSPEQVPFLAPRQAARYRLELRGGAVEPSVLSMGNPHAVLQVASVRDAPVAILGPQLETHDAFPRGVNVGFMEVVDRGRVRLRVHERGVGETRACGSGACAAAVAGRILDLLDKEVAVELPGGILHIYWEGPGRPVWMTGEAVHVFEGRLTQ